MNKTHTLPAAQLRPSEATTLKRIWRDRSRPTTATSRAICNANVRETYTGAEVCMPAMRSGADDALQVPSRINDRLYFRDGRVTDLQGQPVQPHQLTE